MKKIFIAALLILAMSSTFGMQTSIPAGTNLIRRVSYLPDGQTIAIEVANQNTKGVIIMRVNPDSTLTVISVFDAELSNSQAEINTTILSQVKDGNDFKEKVDCIVCTEKLDKKEINLSCGHDYMHYACLAQWMEMKREATCPMCRKKIVKVNR